MRAVRRMLGHASAAMTLDTYADLFEADLDAVGDGLDRAATAAREKVADGCGPEPFDQVALNPGQTPQPGETGPAAWRPRQDSNLRHRLRRATFAFLKIIGKCL